MEGSEHRKRDLPANDRSAPRSPTGRGGPVGKDYIGKGRGRSPPRKGSMERSSSRSKVFANNRRSHSPQNRWSSGSTERNFKQTNDGPPRRFTGKEAELDSLKPTSNKQPNLPNERHLKKNEIKPRRSQSRSPVKLNPKNRRESHPGSSRSGKNELFGRNPSPPSANSNKSFPQKRKSGDEMQKSQVKRKRSSLPDRSRSRSGSSNRRSPENRAFQRQPMRGKFSSRSKHSSSESDSDVSTGVERSRQNKAPSPSRMSSRERSASKESRSPSLDSYSSDDDNVKKLLSSSKSKYAVYLPPSIERSPVANDRKKFPSSPSQKFQKPSSPSSTTVHPGTPQNSKLDPPTVLMNAIPAHDYNPDFVVIPRRATEGSKPMYTRDEFREPNEDDDRRVVRVVQQNVVSPGRSMRDPPSFESSNLAKSVAADTQIRKDSENPKSDKTQLKPVKSGGTTIKLTRPVSSSISNKPAPDDFATKDNKFPVKMDTDERVLSLKRYSFLLRSCRDELMKKTTLAVCWTGLCV